MPKTDDLEKLKKAIKQEKRHIDETLRLFVETKTKDAPTRNDQVAISVYIHNLYMGIENILRRILEFKGVKIEKSESYHRELLLKSTDHGVIPEETRDTLKEFMAFRHRVVHGYGYMLEPEKMQLLIDNAETAAGKFFSALKKNGYL